MTDPESAPIVELSRDQKITLPRDIARRFRPADRFMIWSQGDTVILKRISTPRITEVVAREAKPQPPPSMDEIDEIVHEVRRRRSAE